MEKLKLDKKGTLKHYYCTKLLYKYFEFADFLLIYLKLAKKLKK